MVTGTINTFYEFADYLDLLNTQFYKIYCCNFIRYFFSHSERVVGNPEKFFRSKIFCVLISNWAWLSKYSGTGCFIVQETQFIPFRFLWQRNHGIILFFLLAFSSLWYWLCLALLANVESQIMQHVMGIS